MAALVAFSTSACTLLWRPELTKCCSRWCRACNYYGIEWSEGESGIEGSTAWVPDWSETI